jgi:hypothetical protein
MPDKTKKMRANEARQWLERVAAKGQRAISKEIKAGDKVDAAATRAELAALGREVDVDVEDALEADLEMVLAAQAVWGEGKC